MKPLVFSVLLSAACLVAVPASGQPVPNPGEQTVVEWEFNQAGVLQGWQPNAHLTNVTVSEGILRCQAIGADPILELGPRIDVPASPFQILEVRMKADQDGAAEFFWSNTDQGQYGGFSQAKTTRFNVVGDQQWHVYRLLPCWQTERRIVRLRFDVYGGARFEIDRIRIGQLQRPPAVTRADFDCTRGNPDWLAFDGTTLTPGDTGLVIQMDNDAGFILAPPVNLACDEQDFISLALTVARGSRATLFFATDRLPGWHSLSFPIEADGREHVYNVDMLAVNEWKGQVVALGLRPSEVGQTTATLRTFAVSDEPKGPPQLKVTAFGLVEALPRAGRPIPLTAMVSNFGGEVAIGIVAKLSLPPGMRVIEEPAEGAMKRLAYSESITRTWIVQGDQPLTNMASLEVTAPGAEPVKARTQVGFAAAPAVAKQDYVPEPHPVRGKYEVGAYYFPGWKTASQWQPIEGYPERRPVLGWYREGNPEVADWHIKWAVEHGITFFAYDWYWSKGARQLEHGLHDGYLKARYRHLLKFCLLWANHNAPHTSSREDSLAVTRHWIDQYFRRPEYLTLDGVPVVIIFNPQRFTEDLGGANVATTFAAMRAECVRAGLKGLYLIACVGEAGQAKLASAEGYDAITAYNWPSLGMAAGEKRAPYEGLIGGYHRHWEHLLTESPIPLCLPLNGGWDSRPWHGENNLVRFGRSPELFARHLEDARELLDNPKPGYKLKPLVIVEAWNEWGEGSYIEPQQEFGFGYLDAIRRVFTSAPESHTDLAPADVGRGPYDVAPAAGFATEWEFDRDDGGWNNTMDLTEVRVRDGVLHGRSTGDDPAWFGPPLQARASEFAAVRVRMKLEKLSGGSFQDSAQLFWRTSRLSESEASSVRFLVQGDGQWHEYRLPVAENRRWRQIITRLRLDPCNQTGVAIDVDWVRLER